jgi:nickel-type superoxide dismutase maturation protease
MVRRVVVTGESMLPAVHPGDRLLVVGPWPPRPGHVVAVPDPRRPADRVLVKRVASVDGGVVDLRGDNDGASTDSRHFGPVPARTILGRAVYRYEPPARRGWWP